MNRIERKPATDTKSNYPVGDVTLEELECGLPIDEDALEDAWKEQPECFYRVSKKLALLISQRDEAKRNIAVIEAEVDEEIRKDARSKEQKITEKEIESLKVRDREIVKAYEYLSRLNLKVGEFNALADSYKQRQSALIRMTDMYLAEVYEPKEPRAKGDLMDHTNRATKRELNEMRRRRRMED